VFSKIITAIISIFLIGILTKYLPIELYGSYNKVYSYLWIFAFLADLWLYTITVREISLQKEPKEKIIGNVLTLRTILGLSIWMIAFLVAFLLPWYHDTLTLWAIFIVGAFTCVSLINSSLLALMQSQMKMEFSLISLVAGKLLNISLIALFLIIIFTDVSQIPSAFISIFVAWFLWVSLNTYLNLRYARNICSIRYVFDREYVQYLFKISLPYGIALFLSVVYFKVDIILLSVIESPNIADVSIALYGLPMKIIEVLMVLWWFYLNSLLPSLTTKYKEGNHESIAHMLGISLKILTSFGILIFALWNLLAPEIISIISTPEYLEPSSHIYSSVDALRVVLWVLMFHFIALWFIYMFIAQEKQSFLLKVNIWITLFNIVGNILVIPGYSFVGAAIVTLLSQILLMIICGYFYMKSSGLSLQYYIYIWQSIVLGWWLYLIFSSIMSSVYFGDIVNLLVFWCSFLILYLVWEYLISKKYIIKIFNQYL